MTIPQPQAVSVEIDDEVLAVLLPLSRYLSPDDPRVIDWMDRLDRALQATRMRWLTFMSMGNVMHITGDADRMNRFFDRAAAAGAKPHQIAGYRGRMYQNLGYFSRSLEDLTSVISIRAHNLGMGIEVVTGVGGFRLVADLLDQARLAELGLDHVPQIEDIRQIAAFASRAPFSDEQYSAVLDVAGELLREQGLLWLDLSPQFSFDDEMDCPGVRFRVDLTADEAANMTFAFIDRIVHRNLDSVPLTVGFIGVKAEEPEEAST